MAPELQTLPDELLLEVLRRLLKSDLKSARLTCTRLGGIGAQWLFQRVYFAPHESAIETFLNITANPVFAHTVTELIYDGRLFLHELTAYESYRATFHSPSLVVEQRNCEDDHESIVESLSRYKRLFHEQQSILADRKDFEALSSGLKKLPMLTIITVRNDFSSVCHDWVPLRQVEHSWYHKRSKHEFAPPLTDRYKFAEKCNVRGIQNLFRVIAKRGQNVVELHIGSSRSPAPTSIFDSDQDAYHDVCVMARRLKVLEG